ncbi:hypothetical protein [Parasitella parasitica]|uniref:Uncharacterized protein n=1 Tax=Parasitella parasitica TaxID=35722 RepID=A0A0B7ND39_9FUNG|nr:hypothetical protein [Parasitella parasitica]
MERDFFSLKIKDDCPNPRIFEGKKPNSIVIRIEEAHYVDGFIFVPGYLQELRKQYPEGLVLLDRYVEKRKPDRTIVEKYIEISFANETIRKAALSKPPLKIRDQVVKARKSTYLGKKYVYRLYLKNIDLLGPPEKYEKRILDYLEKFGTVEALHLHYTEGGDWFLGEGCAIIIMSDEDKQDLFDHPTLEISIEKYPVIR